MRKETITALFFLFVIFASVYANDAQYLTINGRVLSEKSGSGISYASIVFKNTPTGTVTNEEGAYRLVLFKNQFADTLVISAIGYQNKYLAAHVLEKQGDIMLEPAAVTDKKLITYTDANSILKKSIELIDMNYPFDAFLAEGFYRSVARENGIFSKLLESAVKIYDRGYHIKNGIVTDFIQLRKSHDYRNFRWYEGDNYMGILLASDLVRQRSGVLNLKKHKSYNMELTGATVYNNEMVYIISASPKESEKKPVYDAKVFVNAENNAILQMELEITDKAKYFYYNRFYTDSSSFDIKKSKIILQYRQYQGICYPSYISVFFEWDIIHKKTKKVLASSAFYDELLVNKIVYPAPVITSEQGIDFIESYRFITDYDSTFWSYQSMPVPASFFNAIYTDLEKNENLEKQFIKNTGKRRFISEILK